MLEIDVRVTTTADPAAVYALLKDGATWPSWSPIGSFELRTGGPEQVGSVRAFRTSGLTSVERIVELVPDKRLSYVLERGLPLRDYRADVDVAPGQIRWHSTFRAKVPGTGWFYRRALGRFIRRCAEGLAARAEVTER